MESPVPLIGGINISSNTFYSKILLKLTKKVKKTTLYVFIDQGLIYFDFEILKEIHIPEFENFKGSIMKFYRNNFNPLVSKYLKINVPSKNTEEEENFFSVKDINGISSRF